MTGNDIIQHADAWPISDQTTPPAWEAHNGKSTGRSKEDGTHQQLHQQLHQQSYISSSWAALPGTGPVVCSKGHMTASCGNILTYSH